MSKARRMTMYQATNVTGRRIRVAEIIRINLGEALNLDDWTRTQLPLISLNVLIREDCCVWLLSHSSFIAAVLRSDPCRRSRRWNRIAKSRYGGAFKGARGIEAAGRRGEFTEYHILPGIGVPTRTHTYLCPRTRARSSDH